MHDAAGVQPQKAVDLAHPLHIAFGQIVVHRDHMHALAGERVQINRRGGRQGLAFAGLHLRDLALVQHNAADELHVVVALAECPPGRFAHHGKGLGQQRVQGFALRDALPELHGFGGKPGIIQSAHALFQPVDPGDDLAVLPDHAVIFAAKHLGQSFSQHRSTPCIKAAPCRDRKWSAYAPAHQIRASSSQSGNFGQCRQSLQILWGRSCLSVS